MTDPRVPATEADREAIIAEEAIDLIVDLCGAGASQSATNCRVVEDHLKQFARRLAHQPSVDREAVARIIDPYIDDDGSHGAYMAWQSALAKADAILALASSAPAESVWTPHLDYAGEPMHPGEFRDPFDRHVVGGDDFDETLPPLTAIACKAAFDRLSTTSNTGKCGEFSQKSGSSAPPPTRDESGLREALEPVVAELEKLAATARDAVDNSPGLADHKLLILANYGDLALSLAPRFRQALATNGGAS